MTRRFSTRTEPYSEPHGAASHFCRRVQSTMYVDRAACPYCNNGDER
jgi:hypothetical protein